MKKSLFILLSLVCSMSLFAVPARPGARQLKQPNGQDITLFAHGDEVYHYYTDDRGNIMERNAEGYWQPTTTKATKENIKALRAARAPRHRAPLTTKTSGWPNKGLVILVNFSDVKFKSGNDNQAFDDLLNGDNYTYNGATGSVKKYYSDQSNGQFVPEFHVYGPVTVSKERSYYGSNKSNGDDRYLGQLIAEACQLAYDQYNINLKDFDLDNDGYVDFVDVLYAGVGEADSDEQTSIWPCEWSLSASDYGKELTLGSTHIDLFSCHQELEGSSGKRAGIGTPCHEFGHVFGLPDFYDYDYPTLGEWDIMDGGAYNNDSRTPPGFSGYERMFAGWAKPELLNQTADLTLNELQGSQQVYIISPSGQHNLDAIDPDPETFYILENRQLTGWDAYLPGHGMLIWKVQYDVDDWFMNTVNAHPTAEQGMAIMAADGEVYNEVYQGYVYTYGDDGDPFPGSKNITSYKKIANYQITDITEHNQIISFTLTTKGSTPVIPGDCTDYDFTLYEKAENGTVEWDGMEWNIYSDGAYFGFDANNDPSKGAQFGSKSQSATTVTISTEQTASCNISKVKVNASTASKGSATLSVLINGQRVGNAKDLSSAATNFTFTPSSPVSGELTIRFDNKAKAALYLKSISIEFDETTGVDNTSSLSLFNIVSTNQQIALNGLKQGSLVSIFNLMGQQLLSEQTSNSQVSVEAPAGIYIISVSRDGQTKTQKVVVR